MNISPSDMAPGLPGWLGVPCGCFSCARGEVAMASLYLFSCFCPLWRKAAQHGRVCVEATPLAAAWCRGIPASASGGAEGSPTLVL